MALERKPPPLVRDGNERNVSVYLTPDALKHLNFLIQKLGYSRAELIRALLEQEYYAQGGPTT